MHKYIVERLNSMAIGLFASLIIGLILEQLGILLGVKVLADFGLVAKQLLGPAIGVSVAYGLKAPPLVIAASLVTGAIGAGSFVTENGAILSRIGDPVGAFVAGLVGAEIGRLLQGRTRLDILVLPAATVVAGGLIGISLAPAIASLMLGIGHFINQATLLHPVPMGIVIAVTMGMLLTLPVSSAAIAISLGLSGLAAGAATVGCAAQMVGFAVISFRENGWGGLIAQGLGTSMLQIPNIAKNPRIWLPPILASAILGPVSTVVFQLENVPSGAGMGTSGLVGQFGTISVMGPEVWPQILLLHFLLPAVLSLVFAYLLRKVNWINPGDLVLNL